MNSQTGSIGYEAIFSDTRRKPAGNRPVCKGLQQVGGENRSYLSDGETAAACHVKGLERATSPACGLFLAYLCDFNAISILLVSS